ncbi:hypothetical protein FACS1894132_06590 [Clostridia bacterium]|nr:hypothetical protein FACS1894132_06590 [Clostridia bacterium]
MDELLQLADKVRELRDTKTEQKAVLDAVETELKDTEQQLTEVMTAAEVPNFTRGDKQFILTSTTRWSAETDKKEELYNVLHEQGYDELFTVNTQTLGSFVKEQASEFADEHGEDGLPDWLLGMVKSYDQVGITVKKATKK